MSCQDELNSQIKGLQSRLSQAESDINSHYAGISQLVLALAANPFTAASAAASAVIYNLNPIGMKLLRALLQSLIPKELQNMMRMLTMLSASSIDQLAEGIVDSAAAQVVAAVNNGIDAVSAAAIGDLTSMQNELTNLVPNIGTNLENIANTLAVNNDRATSVTLAQQAYNAWYSATIAPIGAYTTQQILDLRVVYLKAQQVVNLIDAGAASALTSATGLLGAVSPAVHAVNDALREVNGILAFINTQNDITSCKSISLRIGT